jgi:transcriptional regulator of NAD metabolism
MNQGVVVVTHGGTPLAVMYLIPATQQEPIINQGR